MTEKRSIFLFRRDLRLLDNPGLHAAAQNGFVMPVYILDENIAEEFKTGSASRWWLHHSLADLNNALDDKLNVYRGDTQSVLLKIIQTNEINAVYWNRCYEPWHMKKDIKIKNWLKAMGIGFKIFKASLLWEPWQVLKNDGAAYKVYTPFFRKCCSMLPIVHAILPKPKNLICIKDSTNTMSLNDLGLINGAKWEEKLKNHWIPGEVAAQRKLSEFLDKKLYGYSMNRNYPAKTNTSRLSPYLHFGEISPNQVFQAIQVHKNSYEDKDCFFKELVWREFSYYLLYYFPNLPLENLQNKFDYFPWQHNVSFLQAWQKGTTGYPIIDAGMRELWQTGFMHNRIRMVTASFLVKNLGIHWRYGATWF